MAEQERKTEAAEEEVKKNSQAEENPEAEMEEALGENGEGEEQTSEAEDEIEEAPEGEDSKTWAEKRAAKKQAKQDKKTQVFKEQIEQLEDKVKRQLAEFENFRNRSEKEKLAMFETGAKSVIEKMLPVVDNFERGLTTVPEDKKEDPFVDGMNRIYRDRKSVV